MHLSGEYAIRKDNVSVENTSKRRQHQSEVSNDNI